MRQCCRRIHEPKTRDVIVDFLEAQHASWGRRHWAGSLKSPPQHGNGDGVAAYVADAAQASSNDTAANVAVAEPKPIDDRAAGLCDAWQTGKCNRDPCP